jgi:hypothetical protein
MQPQLVQMWLWEVAESKIERKQIIKGKQDQEQEQTSSLRYIVVLIKSKTNQTKHNTLTLQKIKDKLLAQQISNIIVITTNQQ